MDLNSKTWTQILPDSGALWPSPRFFASATVAPAEYTQSGNSELWIFGGQSGEIAFNELWVLDLETHIWALEAGGENEDSAPAARCMMNAVSRSGTKLVVYGGSASIHPTIPIELSDAWEYDFDGGGWKLLNDGSGDMSSPGKRTYHISSVIAVDGGGDALIVYGGYRHDTILHDVWSLDLASRSWSQLSLSPDLSRMRHSVATEGSNIWSYGGYSYYSTDSGTTETAITTRVITSDYSDANAKQWYEPTSPIGSVPGARYDHTADMWQGRMIIYGGSFHDQTKASNMWSFDVQGADLIAVTSETEFKVPPTFPLFHVLIALGIMMCCMCVFMRTVRSRLDAQAARSMGNDNIPSSQNSNGLSNEELLRLPPLKRFRTLDTEKGTYNMESVNSTPSSLKGPSFNNLKSVESALGIHDDSGKCCAICIDNFGNGDIVRELPCKHEFHASCVDEWLKTTPLCPMCKCGMREAPASPQNQSERADGVDGTGAVEGGNDGSPSAIELEQQAGSITTTTRRRARWMGLSRLTTCPFSSNNSQPESATPRPSEVLSSMA